MSGFYSSDPFGDPFDLPQPPQQQQPVPSAQGSFLPYQQPQPYVYPSAEQQASSSPSSFLSKAPSYPVVTPVGGSMSSPVSDPFGSPVMAPGPYSASSPAAAPMSMPYYQPPPQSPVPQQQQQPASWAAPSPPPSSALYGSSSSPVPAPSASSPAPVVLHDDDFGISWAKPAEEAVPRKAHGPPPAPAPPAPPSSATKEAVAAEEEEAPSSAPVSIIQQKATGPPPDGVLLARVTQRSIFVREWKPCYWIILNQRLWIYRSKADFDPTDYIHNPFNERIKKQIPLRDSLRITDVKGKVYPGESKTLYTFNVEDSEEDGGKMVLSKFAAYDWDQIRYLHEELHRRVADLQRAKRR